jgi:hypothetical protein
VQLSSAPPRCDAYAFQSDLHVGFAVMLACIAGFELLGDWHVHACYGLGPWHSAAVGVHVLCFVYQLANVRVVQLICR